VFIETLLFSKWEVYRGNYFRNVRISVNLTLLLYFAGQGVALETGAENYFLFLETMYRAGCMRKGMSTNTVI